MDFEDQEAVLPDESSIVNGPQTENADETASQATGENKQDGQTPSSDGANSQNEVPFHQHPRWKQREEEWNQRFNETQAQYEGRIAQLEQSLRPIIQNQQPVQIPPFFSKVYGDDPQLYREYMAEQQALEQRAVQRAKFELQQETQAQNEAQVAEEQHWAGWVDESVQQLKDEGKTFDENRLKAIAIKHMPTDLEGNIDFHKAYEIMQLEESATHTADAQKSSLRKEIGASASAKGKGESKEKDFLTHDDIKKGAARL